MQPSEIRGQRILLSPLNWGMGHVARCIPLIDLFLKNGNTVVVAANSFQIRIFRAYFPKLQFVDHSGYPFSFSGNGSFESDLLKQFTKLRSRLLTERKEVDYLVDIHQIDLVVSDHRYGFRSSKCKSVILTHQLNLPVKWYEGWVQRWHCKLLRSFDELWIPDSPDSKYAGKLSENKDQHKVEYIGILSRFSIYTKPIDKDIERLVIISGPTVYGKQQLQEELSKHDDGVTYFVADKDIFEELNLIGEQFVSSNDWTSADQIILRAKKIISRSGYSTLMDLVELKAAYEITPTRGQREQEYLFGLWNNNPLC